MRHVVLFLIGNNAKTTVFPITPRIDTYDLVIVERKLVDKQRRLEQMVMEMEPIRLNHLDILLTIKPERKVWPSDNLINKKAKASPKAHKRQRIWKGR